MYNGLSLAYEAAHQAHGLVYDGAFRERAPASVRRFVSFRDVRRSVRQLPVSDVILRTALNDTRK